MKTFFTCLVALFFSMQLATQCPEVIRLESPDKLNGKPLMEALSLRSSHREFSDKALSEKHLSGLLWAAWGINRSADKKRTAPSANNVQDITVYAIFPDGIYRYQETDHTLVLVAAGDYRKAAGTQEFVYTAPLNLVLVSDYAKLRAKDPVMKARYAGLSAGYVSQNVYLYCASEGINTVVRASFDKEALRKALQLGENEEVIVSQTVGYPK